MTSSGSHDDRDIDRDKRASEEQNRQNEIPTQKKSSVLIRVWEKLGLNVNMLMMMIKGAFPPTIALALYQSTAFADTYSTLGYLVAITSILSFSVMPRAKFVQTMLFNIIGITVGFCITLLCIYCSVQARAHTTSHTPSGPSSSSGGPSPGAAVASYNSSASAVCALWLFFNIYVANMFRASRPQLQFPVIMYSIYANVSSTYAPQFATMAQGIVFARRLLETFMTGFAIAGAVLLLVFPVTSREIVFRTTTTFIGALRNALKAQLTYLESLEDKETLGGSSAPQEQTRHAVEGHKDSSGEKLQLPKLTPQVSQLKAAMAILGELHGKINGDITFAKREIAYGKLNAAEMSELIKLLRQIMLPIIGMSSLADIFDRVAERRGWRIVTEDHPDQRGRSEAVKDAEKAQWSEIIKSLHQPFEILTEAMDAGLQHALLTLELEKHTMRRRKQEKGEGNGSDIPDLEANGSFAKPGEKGFAAFLSMKIGEFHKQRKKGLDTWYQQGENELAAVHSRDLQYPDSPKTAAPRDHQRKQRQLYLILYMQFLLWSTGRAVLDLIKFADRKVEQNTLTKKRLIMPGMKRAKKWVLAAIRDKDSTVDHAPDSCETTGINIEAGDAHRRARDPEHLPPRNHWQRFGNGIRVIPRILASQESSFGFRVGCATLSIGIVAFLKETQTFFIQQRLVWAMIMVAISMTVTAGAGVFGFIGRIIGTTIAMCTSYLIWYAVNGKTPGVIVLIFVFTFCETYFVLKFPRFIVIALISMVTQVLVVGYELQVQKVGILVAQSSGQPAYPLYQLAPYRLACVSGGMLVAFFWTFFPYPLTARSRLRKELGTSLYLLAKFYSCVHTTIGVQLGGSGGSPIDKSSPRKRLDKARNDLFTKELALLANLRQHSAFTSWEPSLGGNFPRQRYDTIIEQVHNVMNYVALISYASNILSDDDEGDPDQVYWLRSFRHLVHSIRTTSQELTSTLLLLAASVTNGSPLPPYLRVPEPYRLSTRLEAIDPYILNVKHVSEPGYAAFAVMQIASSLINDDMTKLISNVKALVGEVDFSFHGGPASDAAPVTTDASKGKTD